MATALKLKSDIKKLKAAINSKATPKSFLPKLKNQLERAEGELKSLKEAPKGGKPKKSTSAGTEKTLTALQKLVNKKKYSVYKGRGVDLKKDAGEGALATGRRVSKGLKSNQWGDKSSNKGNVYYEYRPNRLDVKQPKKKQTYPKLEDGGMMAMGGEIRYKLKGSNFGQQIENGQKFKALISKVHANQSGENKYPENLIKEIAYTGKIVKSDGSNYLKDYSYKGTLTKFEFLDDKDFIEALKYVDRPAIRKFEEGGYMDDGGQTDMLNEGDYVWNAVGKKLVVDKVTEDEYYLSGFMQKGDSPFSKEKVHEYIKTGQWSLSPKMAEGGELHRSSEKYAEGGETKKFSEREFKDILDEALEHFYMGLNKIDSAMRYLEVKGQAGLKNPFSAKIGLSNLKESIEKIDEYTSKK